MRLWFRATAPIGELGIDAQRLGRYPSGCEVAIDEVTQTAARTWDGRLKELPVSEVLPYIADGRLVLDP